MKINKFPNELNENLAEETGWHIGDGSMNYYNNQGKQKGIYQLRGHIEDDKPHYIQRIKPIFKELYGIDISLREMPSTRVFGFQIWSSELVNFKHNLGLCLGPKIAVEIPSAFLQNEILKIAVLRGIFDTDGGIYLQKKNGKLYPRLEIKTISNTLGEQLLSILKELGIRATKYLESGTGPNRKPSYAIVTRGNEMFHKFMKIVNSANPKHFAKYDYFLKSGI